MFALYLKRLDEIDKNVNKETVISKTIFTIKEWRETSDNSLSEVLSMNKDFTMFLSVLSFMINNIKDK